ncbi:unnamed protein product [Leptidea sinapis]|uniref:Uncharacterized protein n=1 Tax=Leptidea sinapis TaxID=189913 RepID=A0A5E4QD05_9NEOP|nr:unnamed protein product [Leptidea sinapis]
MYTKETMNQQLAELLAEPSGEFDNFVRMSCTDFEYLLHKISPMVSKQDTTWRKAVPTKIRLALTLRFKNLNFHSDNNYYTLYTDGSKSELFVRSAVYDPQSKFGQSFLLNPQCSDFTAEIV